MKNKKVDRVLLVVLAVLGILTIVFVPLLIIAEVKRMLPIVFFIVIPVLLALIIVLLSRNCLDSYDRKKKKIVEKLNAR